MLASIEHHKAGGTNTIIIFSLLVGANNDEDERRKLVFVKEYLFVFFFSFEKDVRNIMELVVKNS